MSSNSRNNRINQPENLEKENNANQMNLIPLRNPTIGDYFRRNENVRHKGHVDSIKLGGIVRLASVNANGCSPTNERKMHQLREAVENYGIDMLLLNEVNAKWNTVNISRMERILKNINQATKLLQMIQGNIMLPIEIICLVGQ